MNAWSRECRVAGRHGLVICAGVAALVLGAAAQAEPRSVEAFGQATWRALQSAVTEPTVVVFSATWCPNCPAVIDDLASTIRERGLPARLDAVVMDVAPGADDRALLSNDHYRLADRLYAFKGQAPALRWSVDKRWRGETPYVVFLTPGAPPRAVSGAPADADIEAWLQPVARPPAMPR